MTEDKRNLVKELLKSNLKKICSIFQLDFKWDIIQEFENESQFINQINECISKNDIFRTRKFESIYQFSTYRNVMYYLVRLLKPKCSRNWSYAWTNKCMDTSSII